MEIKIDVSDWEREAASSEENAASLKDLIDLAIEKGWPSSRIYRMYEVMRQWGKAEGDLLPPTKSLLEGGGTQSLDVVFARCRREIEIGNRTYRVREMVAETVEPETEEGDDEEEPQAFPRWHGVGSPAALQSATRYIARRVVGLIMGRFLVIRQSGGNVREIAEDLKAKIDELVDALEEESEPNSA